MIATAGDALLVDILATPADDAPRLILADWLEENGDPARAEFIRVQCELAVLAPGCQFLARGQEKPCHVTARPTSISCRWCVLHRRQRDLLNDRGYSWCDGLLGPGWKTAGGEKAAPHVSVEYCRGSVRHPFTLTFRRGFVCRVRLPQAAWLDHGPALARAHPVERVELSDKEPIHFVEGHTWAYSFVLYEQLRQGYVLDPRLYARLRGGALTPGVGRAYPDAPAASDALSAACLLYARQE